MAASKERKVCATTNSYAVGDDLIRNHAYCVHSDLVSSVRVKCQRALDGQSAWPASKCSGGQNCGTTASGSNCDNSGNGARAAELTGSHPDGPATHARAPDISNLKTATVNRSTASINVGAGELQRASTHLRKRASRTAVERSGKSCS